MLELENVVFRYSRRAEPVLRGVSLTLNDGEIGILLGKNGAGKTTLLRLICGLQRPTAGGYCLYGVPHTDKALCTVRRRMGAVVETPSIYMDLPAQENLKQQYRVLGLPSFSGIPAQLELVGLQDTGGKKARHFSLGMRQRLGIAMALAGDPDFLVLDEPTNGLDPQGIIEVRELILKLNREFGITVLISSHILGELSKLATHYGFIDGGRIVQEISAEALEAACRKCARLTVSDVRALARVLDRLGFEYQIVSETQADVFGTVNVTQLTLALAEEGCEVVSMQERDESLESYYVNLLGGARRA